MMAPIYFSHMHAVFTDLKQNYISQLNLLLRNFDFFLFSLHYPLRGWSQ